MRSTRILLAELIDYAGLFPPAALGMAEAVAQYAAHRGGPDAWMLGRFITPAARLDEFEEAARKHLPFDSDAVPWKVSALGGTDLAPHLTLINDFNRRHTLYGDEGRVFVDTLEIKAVSVEEVEQVMKKMHPTLSVYIEIPLAENPQTLIQAIAREGVRAKVRSGGVTPEAFPTSSDLAAFMAACARSGVAFKATAGLHHAVRSVHRLTYEPDSPFGLMHGFLNVLLAATSTSAGKGEESAIDLLEETSADEFRFDDEGVTWRGLGFKNEQLARARELMVAFGSCSFEQPIEDLSKLGIL
jgi:hypothetical protein